MAVNFLCNFFFPPRCLHCRTYIKESETLCESCASRLTLHQSLWCGKCRARIPKHEPICHGDFPYVLGSALDYHNDVTRSIIHAVKFEYVRGGALYLGTLLALYAQRAHVPKENAVVIPIPLSTRRLRTRGFNQAELIAKKFSELSLIPIETDVLLRHIHTPPQADLTSFEARRNNVRGCFAVSHHEKIKGKYILLIDDVTTSGATFFEAAASLKDAGARRIVALAASRA